MLIHKCLIITDLNHFHKEWTSQYDNLDQKCFLRLYN